MSELYSIIKRNSSHPDVTRCMTSHGGSVSLKSYAYDVTTSASISNNAAAAEGDRVEIFSIDIKPLHGWTQFITDKPKLGFTINLRYNSDTQETTIEAPGLLAYLQKQEESIE